MPDTRLATIFANVHAVLFDLDGTLVETNIDFGLMKREMVEIAVSHGVEADQVAGLDILAIVDTTAEHVRQVEGDERAAWVRTRALLTLEQIELRYSPFAKEVPEARRLIRTLGKLGIAVGIVTRNCRAASIESLEKVGIEIEVLLSREDVLRTKPSPDQLLEALRLLGAAPERSLMVGDHIMDIIAGKAAGMRTIGLLTAGRPPDFFAGVAPDGVARDLGEILSALINHHS